jgi:hypothetical protein
MVKYPTGGSETAQVWRKTSGQVGTVLGVAGLGAANTACLCPEQVS